MYFLFSKLLIYVLYPVIWVFAILITALVTKNPKRKRRLFIAGIIILYLFSIPFPLNNFAAAWNVDWPTPDSKHYSCAIVLGGFSTVDKNGKGYFNESADRFIQGVKLLSAKKIDRLLISGGSGDLRPGSFREADWVRTQLHDLHFPDTSILTENKSRNTLENAAFSKKILEKAHLKPPYLLVTSIFHMRRADMIFKKAGVDVVDYPCSYTGGDKTITLDSFIPDAGALAGWGFYIKEVVGYVVDYYK